MDKYGYFRVGAAVPTVALADTRTNAIRICELIGKAVDKQVSLLVFPQLCITGSSCGQLFAQPLLLEGADNALKEIALFTVGLPITVIVGLPVQIADGIHNCYAVLNNGDIIDMVPEGSNKLFSIDGAIFGFSDCPTAHVIVRPAAEKDNMRRGRSRMEALKAYSAEGHKAWIHSGSGYGESTSRSAYSGCALIVEDGELLASGEEFSTEPQLVIADLDIHKINYRNKDCKESGESPEGDILDINMFPETSFSRKLYRDINPLPFIPGKSVRDEELDRACRIQSYALASRMCGIGCRKVVIGISGGLDSTMALLCAVRTFDMMKWDRKGIIAVTMPGFGTSKRTRNNASELMERLKVTTRTIDITAACRQHLEDIGHSLDVQDVAYENAQARERTQILMDVANMENAIVIGTGDLSELALGWCTYNGDHMSNYAVNASIPKTLIRELVSWTADTMFAGDRTTAAILYDIVETPVSPELKSDNGEISQKTEDIVGPYELHDFFIFNMVHCGFPPRKLLFTACRAFKGVYSKAEILKWLKLFLKRFFSQQFKRSCSPDGPDVTGISLDPDSWVVPSDASANLWIDDLN